MEHEREIYIDGQWRTARGPEHDVIDPASEAVVARIGTASEDDVNDSLAAARRVFEGDWGESTPDDRAALLERIVAEIDVRADAMADAITTEMGAPLSFSRSVQVAMPRERFVRAAEIVSSYQFEEQVGSSLVVREPIGVCAFITPWNWPLNQAASKIAYALAAGCTIVWKPSEESPLSAMLLTEAIHAAGAPAGVFNMVQGDGPRVGARLSSHPLVDMVSFTGSTRGGIAVAKAAADTVKRVHQELGGKSANLILPSADFEDAVFKGTRRCFTNSGQSCQAPSRMLVPRDKMDEAAAIAKRAAESLTLGDPRNEATDLGPLVSKAQWERVQSLIEAGLSEGATLVTGGAGKPTDLDTGYYTKPTVFADVTTSMTVAKEEIFGPVLSILAYEDEADAISIANDSVYGLSAYISSTDETEMRRVAKKLRVGRVYFNHAPARGDVPFGGYRMSGNGREQGVHGFEDFTELKAILGYGEA